MKLFLGLAGILVLVFGLFFILRENTVEISLGEEREVEDNIVAVEERPDGDLPYQAKLKNPPSDIRAVYITSWVAGTPRIFNKIIKKIEDTEINAVVIDVKDYSGFLVYNTDNELAHSYGAVDKRITHLNKMIHDLHEKNLYVIARVTVFQDPRLAKARPDLAVLNSEREVWQDRHELEWVSPTSSEVWDYIVSIAKELDTRGVDEVNFDYVRFPTDGVGIGSLVYNNFDINSSKREVINNFFSYLRENLQEVTISADIFGQTVVNRDDMGIGQVIEDAYNSFDYIAPMIYPSHFINGFIGYENPAEYPFEVVKYSMEQATERLYWHERVLTQGKATTTPALTLEQKRRVQTKLRPWIQDFDLGADYTVEMVREQMRAIEEVLGEKSYMIWNPANKYRDEIFMKDLRE